MVPGGFAGGVADGGAEDGIDGEAAGVLLSEVGAAGGDAGVGLWVV
jgi:hypothetical protein